MTQETPPKIQVLMDGNSPMRAMSEIAAERRKILLEMYNSGLSISKLADLFGMHRQQVQYMLKKAGYVGKHHSRVSRAIPQPSAANIDAVVKADGNE